MTRMLTRQRKGPKDQVKYSSNNFRSGVAGLRPPTTTRAPAETPAVDDGGVGRLAKRREVVVVEFLNVFDQELRRWKRGR